MGQGLVSYSGTATNAAGGMDSPISVALRARREQIEEKLEDLYERVEQLLDDNRDKVLELAAVLEEKKTISGDEVADIMGSLPGEKVMREPVGWQTVTGEISAQRRQDALARRQGLGNGRDDVGAPAGTSADEEELEPSANGHQADEEPAEA